MVNNYLTQQIRQLIILFITLNRNDMIRKHRDSLDDQSKSIEKLISLSKETYEISVGSTYTTSQTIGIEPMGGG